jgi:hypothetical protein
MSLNKSLLALTITIALDATAVEVDALFDQAREVLGFDSGLSPTEAAAIVGGEAATTSAALPWDERIHASTKATNADGSWRYKRGVDKGLISKVEAELRAAVSAAPPAAASNAPPAPPAGLPAMPGPPPIPSAPAATPEQLAYTDLVKFLAENTRSATNTNGRLTDEYIGQMLTHYGVPDGSLQNLAHAPQLVPTIHAGFKQALGIA